MQKILYIHGYNGSPYGSSYQHLKAACGEVYELHSIDYDPTQPRAAIKAIHDYITTHQINIVIGASLGGFLTIYLSGVSRMVVNPCWNPALELPKVGYTGPLRSTKRFWLTFLCFTTTKSTTCAQVALLMMTNYLAHSINLFSHVISLMSILLAMDIE